MAWQQLGHVENVRLTVSVRGAAAESDADSNVSSVRSFHCALGATHSLMSAGSAWLHCSRCVRV